jgi:hypothetical protein
MKPEKLAERNFNTAWQLSRSIETVLEIGKARVTDHVITRVFPADPEYVTTGKLILWKSDRGLELHIHEPGEP